MGFFIGNVKLGFVEKSSYVKNDVPFTVINYIIALILTFAGFYSLIGFVSIQDLERDVI